MTHFDLKIVQFFSQGWLRDPQVYAFVREAMGPRTGVVAGWALLGTYFVFPPVSLVSVAIFGSAFLKSSGLWSHPKWLPIALLGWALTWLLAMLAIIVVPVN